MALGWHFSHAHLYTGARTREHIRAYVRVTLDRGGRKEEECVARETRRVKVTRAKREARMSCDREIATRPPRQPLRNFLRPRQIRLTRDTIDLSWRLLLERSMPGDKQRWTQHRIRRRCVRTGNGLRVEGRLKRSRNQHFRCLRIVPSAHFSRTRLYGGSRCPLAKVAPRYISSIFYI